MREILFKAKRIDNGEWVQWSLLAGIEDSEIDKNTICQFTGMTTQSGQKVWEHDIIQHQYGEEKAAVEYGTYHSELDTRHTAHCGFYVDWNERHVLRKDLGYWIEMGAEVIGNAFDNPELLKKE